MGTTVNANPTKEFFISMLTRDIDVKAAIVELIDNSIDGAKRLRASGDYHGLFINITYDRDSFRIQDNCGGISIKTARDYAFRFGRSSGHSVEKAPGQHFTGVFGIGMKRSLFRLGTEFEITSNTEEEHFKLHVNVDEWIKDDSNDWTFQLSEEGQKADYPDQEVGTDIFISKLHEGISDQFGLKYFFTTLTLYIERFRTIAMENGLEITINGQPIYFSSDQIIQTNDITPYGKEEIIDDVIIRIIAGIVPKGEPEKAGWYIYCNGRLVVFADKTNLTGWGEDGTRLYHPSLAFFRGYAYFESNNSDSLPWNTTKTGVDTSSKYYIYAKRLMQEATQQVVKECSQLIDSSLPVEAENAVFQSKKTMLTTATIISTAEKNSCFSLNVPEIKNAEPTSTISFSKPKKMIEHMKQVMGVSTNKDVGINSFDYYYKRECEEYE